MGDIIWDIGFLQQITEKLRQASAEMENAASLLREELLLCAVILGEKSPLGRQYQDALRLVLRNCENLASEAQRLESSTTKVGTLIQETENSLTNLISPSRIIWSSATNSMIHTRIGEYQVMYTGMAKNVSGIVPEWLNQAAANAFSTQR